MLPINYKNLVFISCRSWSFDALKFCNILVWSINSWASNADNTGVATNDIQHATYLTNIHWRLLSWTESSNYTSFYPSLKSFSHIFLSFGVTAQNKSIYQFASCNSKKKLNAICGKFIYFFFISYWSKLINKIKISKHTIKASFQSKSVMISIIFVAGNKHKLLKAECANDQLSIFFHTKHVIFQFSNYVKIHFCFSCSTTFLSLTMNLKVDSSQRSIYQWCKRLLDARRSFFMIPENFHPLKLNEQKKNLLDKKIILVLKTHIMIVQTMIALIGKVVSSL